MNDSLTHVNDTLNDSLTHTNDSLTHMWKSDSYVPSSTFWFICERLSDSYGRQSERQSDSYEWQSDSYVKGLLICESLTHMCHMDDSLTYKYYVRRDSFTYATWRIHVCVSWARIECGDRKCRSCVWACLFHVCRVRYDSLTCVTSLIHMCDMTHLHVRHDSFTCVNRHIHMCDSSEYVWLVSTRRVWQQETPLMCVGVSLSWVSCAIWIIQMCDMTHPHVRHDAFTCVNRRIRMCDSSAHLECGDRKCRSCE